VEAAADGAGDPGTGDGSRLLGAAAEQLRVSMDAVERRIRTGERGCYTRAAALVALAVDELRPRHSPLQHALRDLTLLDGTLARLAAALEMDVADHDTSPDPGTTAFPGAPVTEEVHRRTRPRDRARG
jgi:hypothetical protein